MKKFMVFLVCLSTIFLWTSCTKNLDNEHLDNNTHNQFEDNHDRGQSSNNSSKLEGTLTNCTAFSEGLAFAAIKEDKTTVYCINPKREIVFSVQKDDKISMGWLDFNGDVSFVNGFAYLNGFFNGGLCDKTGKITLPEDVGVTKFYDNALEKGYIIAEITISDYANTTQKLGIMNTNFEWIYEPTTELFEQVKELDYRSKVFDDYLYAYETKNLINLKTGQLVDPMSISIPSEAWNLNGSGVFYNPITRNEILLDISNRENVFASHKFSFGTSVTIYYNSTAQKYYFNLIDKNGEFVFNPVEVPHVSNASIEFVNKSENVILLKSWKTFYSYDTKGNFLGSVDMSHYRENLVWSNCRVHDKTIVIKGAVYNVYGSSTEFAYIFDEKLVEQ